MNETYKIAIGTLMEVASALAAGRSEACMDNVEQMLLLLEVQQDNWVAQGKPTKELEELRQQFIELQTKLFMYADNG